MACGFIDLSIDEVMEVQRRLLMEQIDLMKRCELGRKIMRGAEPKSMEEFREMIPLTTYNDYCPYLIERQEDVLPEKPAQWQHTSGLSGEKGFKWVPITQRQLDELSNVVMAYLIFTTCRWKGDINFKEHEKLLYGVAPPPYTTGSLARVMVDLFDFLPPIDEAETMPFEERIQKGFKLALSEGLDYFFGLPSILVAVADKLNGSVGLKDVPGLLSKPGLAMRLSKAFVKAKLARRPMLPKDIWDIKGIAAAGTDGAIYRERIKEMWGKYPLDIYGSTEASLIAIQTWDFKDMTFLPFSNFMEFIPEEECLRSKADPTYRPRTFLMNELKPGQAYEVVSTSFRGGAFMRYRVGDMIRITALRNNQLNIDIPQMKFECRVDGLIDLAGFTRLTEKTLWQALENTGLPYRDWMARKEATDTPVLHFYIELKQLAGGGNGFGNGHGNGHGNGNGNGHGNGHGTSDHIARAIHDQLRKLDTSYCDLEDMTGLLPIKVTVLPEGTFQGYIDRQRNAGADLAHLKPPHLNASDKIIDTLMTCVTP